MAAFTMELWKVLEHTDNRIGLDEYPIFRELYRETLNKKIIDHYWNQEIGMETIPLFTLALRRRMNEIMPYYNQLYESELLEINPINTIDMRTESESTSQNTGQSEATNTSVTGSKSRSVQSDFPQHRLAGDNDYATAAADSVSDSDVTSEANENSNSQGTNSGFSHTTGTQGLQSDMLIRFRESFLNIDVMVIAELADCFMGVWNNTDAYSERYY